MTWLMYAVSGLAVAAGAVLLVVAVVILVQPAWYRRRWGRPPSGRLAPLYSAPFTLSQGKKRSWLYVFASSGAPYDDLVVGQGLDDAANDLPARPTTREQR